METKPAIIDTISENKDYLASLYNLLKDQPDLSRFPFPKAMYVRYDIPPPKIPTLKEALKMHYENQLAYLNRPDAPEVEIRPPAKGGVRPFLNVEPLEMKVYHGKTLNDIDLSGNLVEHETTQGEESK